MKAWYAPALEVLLGIHALLPSTKDTVSGRASRTRWKAGLVLAGVVFLIGGRESTWFALPALLLLASAAALPLTDQGKRKGAARLRRARTREVRKPHTAQLVHDGRRLELWQGDTKLRHVRTDRAFEWSPWRDERDASVAWWSVRPQGSEKKRDVIWIAVEGGASTTPEDTPALPRDDVVDPAHVTDDVWRPIHERLQARSATDEG
ncbi:MAG: hypothetical protein AAGI01_00655 [Myxococcota bacterium]